MTRPERPPTTFMEARVRAVVRAVVGTTALVLVGGAAGVLPFASPGPVHPIGRWINLVATQSAQSAYVHAMLAQGYELTAPVKFLDGEV